MKLPTIALEKVDFLPPTRVTDDASILTLKNLVLEPMIRWSCGRTSPSLFAIYELSDDGRNWRFVLRDGVMFHDGKLVQAEDARTFINTILGARDMFGMPWSYARYLDGAQIDAKGAELRISTVEPFPDLPEILSEFYLPRADANDAPIIGTGPWRVESFAACEEAVLAHADGRRLRFVAIAEAEDRLEALQNGRIQAAMHMERLNIPRRALRGFYWQEQAITMSVMSYMNGRCGAFTDPRARLAANLAIDRNELVRDVMGGLGLPAATTVSHWHMGFGEARISTMPFDPTRAAALLKTVGGPREITLRSPLYMPQRAPNIAAFLAYSLAEVGFKVTQEIAADRPGYAKEVGEKYIGDLAIFDSSPHSSFRVLDDKISSLSRGVWWQGIEDARADALFETARREI
ncbi:MAG: ABC transporter substrate-binding protein, partial [Paracoccaceae bacterium]|nr:ABC transporter substrate-binding protein [Paracoccaceae bacterium]